jgi:hypothetical protein
VAVGCQQAVLRLRLKQLLVHLPPRTPGDGVGFPTEASMQMDKNNGYLEEGDARMQGWSRPPA